MSNVGFAACSRLMLGGPWRILPSLEPGGWIGGAPLDRMDRLSISSAAAGGGLPPLTCLAPVSFLGGVGAWSACAGAGAGDGDGAGSAAPNGPRGSRASSTDCNMVDWARAFLAGAFLPPADLEVAGFDSGAGVEVEVEAAAG